MKLVSSNFYFITVNTKLIDGYNLLHQLFLASLSLFCVKEINLYSLYRFFISLSLQKLHPKLSWVLSLFNQVIYAEYS